MEYTRKNLREITGLPDKSLRWLLEKLDIQPVGLKRTLFGAPVYIYNDSALDALHDYIFKRNTIKSERCAGTRCRGGCNRYLARELLNSSLICDRCRRFKWILNEATHGNPLCNSVDPEVLQDLQVLIAEVSRRPPSAA